MTTTIDPAQVGDMITGLIGRDATAKPAADVAVHPATYRGLVTDENHLAAVMACDLEFAHRSGAALAMVPPVNVSEPAEAPDDDYLEFYSEVVNVLSRLVNELAPVRLRLDPGIQHSEESLQAVIDSGTVLVAAEADIEGYGSGKLGVWYQT